jgi:hypothetical protein
MARPRKVIAELPAQESTSPAQDLAMRIWRGQSVSLPHKERVRRIEAALAGHNFPADDIAAIKLPE